MPKDKDMKIISLGEEYIDDVLEIENLSFPIPWSRQAFTQEVLENQLSKYLIAVDANKAIAYGGMWLILDEAHITNIAVHPDYRRRGIGRKIVSGLIDYAKEKEIYQLTLEVRKSNEVAIHLYESCGFEIAGVRKNFYSDNNEDALIMWKKEK